MLTFFFILLFSLNYVRYDFYQFHARNKLNSVCVRALNERTNASRWCCCFLSICFFFRGRFHLSFQFQTLPLEQLTRTASEREREGEKLLQRQQQSNKRWLSLRAQLNHSSNTYSNKRVFHFNFGYTCKYAIKMIKENRYSFFSFVGAIFPSDETVSLV